MKPIANQYNTRDIERVQGSLPSVSLFTFAGGCEHSHLPTALVRWFKDGRLRGESRNLHEVANALADLAAEAVLQITAHQPYTHICRALGSWETMPEPTAPLELFQNYLAERLKLEVIHPFARTQTREPMSLNRALSGSDTFRKRAWMAGQDMVVVTPCPDARVLLVDDIRCLGATESVLAWALGQLGGAKATGALTLAQMEGLGGSQVVLDFGMEHLATGRKESGFWSERWLEPGSGAVHASPECPKAEGTGILWLSGLSGSFSECQSCLGRETTLLLRLWRKISCGRTLV